MNFLEKFFSKKIFSKKLLMSLATSVAIIFNDSLGINLTSAQVYSVASVALGYLFSQGRIDEINAKK